MKLEHFFNSERPLPKKGEIWRHFKGAMYKIVGLSMLADNDKQNMNAWDRIYVVYTNSREELFIRNTIEFMSKVDREKYPIDLYPDYDQEYRFELLREMSDING